DIGHAFGSRMEDYLLSIREKLKPFDEASLVRDMAKAAQAGREQDPAVYRVLQAELLRRQQMAIIKQAEGSWSGNWSLTGDHIGAMTKETIGRLLNDRKISAEEAGLALAGPSLSSP